MYNDSFKVRYKGAPVAISENRDGVDTAPHIHAEIELLYVVSGVFSVNVSDRSYHAVAGDIVIVNPFDVHSIKRLSPLPASTLCICIEPSLIFDSELAAELSSGVTAAAEHIGEEERVREEISGYFKRLYTAVEQSSLTLRLEAGAYLSLIFSRLIASGLIKSRAARGKKESFTSKIQEYLKERYREDITSETVAEELFYTQSYFCRLFKKQFGISFLEYLSLYRISKAKELLEDPSAKVSMVAEAVGFTDSAYFARCFKRLVGISPSEYKKHQYSY